jgi:hypothetical protein
MEMGRLTYHPSSSRKSTARHKQKAAVVWYPVHFRDHDGRQLGPPLGYRVPKRLGVPGGLMVIDSASYLQ